MALTFPTSGGGNYKSVPPGTHFAVCNLIAFLGLQPGTGKFPDPKYQLYMRFEVPTERVEYERDGKKYEGPVVIGQRFTASMHEKSNLRKQLEGWRGKKFTDDEASSFDIATVLGQSCMLSVVEKVSGGKVYANIQGIGGLPKGATKLRAENPLIIFDPDHPEAYEALPEWLRKLVDGQIKPNQTSTTRPEDGDPGPDYDSYVNQHGVGITDDDIPF